MELASMDILKSDAALALRKGRDPKKVVLYYGLIAVLVAALITVASFWLEQRMDNFGGLGNMGTRTVLATVQMMLPLAQSVVLMGLEFGYLHAMMRIARRQYADHTDLKVGFEKFFPLLRLTILEGMIYFGGILVSYQLTSILYLLTPWAKKLTALVEHMAASGVMDPMELMTEEFVLQATPLVVPMMVILAIVCAVVLIPFSYRLRFARYALLDDSRGSALMAIRTSVKLTRRNCVRLLKLDLSFWWYYLAMVLVSLLGYLDVLLPMFGILLPLNSTVIYFLTCGVCLAGSFAVNWFLRNPVECTYLLAYESVREKKADEGVILGNIFDMQ